MGSVTSKGFLNSTAYHQSIPLRNYLWWWNSWNRSIARFVGDELIRNVTQFNVSRVFPFVKFLSVHADCFFVFSFHSDALLGKTKKKLSVWWKEFIFFIFSSLFFLHLTSRTFGTSHWPFAWWVINHVRVVRTCLQCSFFFLPRVYLTAVWWKASKI